MCASLQVFVCFFSTAEGSSYMNINISPHRGPGCGHTAVAGIEVISPAGLETFKSQIQFGGELQTQPLVNML